MEDTKYETPDARQQGSDEVEIDLMEYVRKLWAARKPLLISIGVGIVVGLIIAFSVPKKYTVEVTLAPELGKTTTSSSISSVASMLGLSTNTFGNDEDALNVVLFPNIVSSIPFIAELFDELVVTADGKIDTTFIGYLDYVRKPWWGAAFALVGKAIDGVKSIFTSGEEEDDEGTVNPFRLTKEQTKKVKYIRESITASVDKNTGVTTISVTLQDALVAAHMADVVIGKLQEYIIAYRVSKAEQDCEYYEQLFKERQQEYYAAQQDYAKYVDANKGVILQSALTERERLQNDMNLAYQVYSQVSAQLQVARAKVQEAKPAFAVVEPATVPIKPSGLSKKLILVIIVFLAFVVEAVWVLWCKDLWAKMKSELKTTPADSSADADTSASEKPAKKSRRFFRKKNKDI